MLDWTDQELNPEARGQLYQAVGEMLAAQHEHRVEGKCLAGRVEEVSRILDEQGYLVDWTKDQGVFRISWHSCPYYRVAQTHRDVCLVDAGFLSRLLGVEIELTDCLLDGGGCCTLTIPDPDTGEIGIPGEGDARIDRSPARDA